MGIILGVVGGIVIGGGIVGAWFLWILRNAFKR